MQNRIMHILNRYFYVYPSKDIYDFEEDFWSGHLAKMHPEFVEDLMIIYSNLLHDLRMKTTDSNQPIIDIADGRAFVGCAIKSATEIFPNLLNDSRRENLLLIMGERRDVILNILCGDSNQIRTAIFDALNDDLCELEISQTWSKHWQNYSTLFARIEGLPSSSTLSNWQKSVSPHFKHLLRMNLKEVMIENRNLTPPRKSGDDYITSFPTRPAITKFLVAIGIIFCFIICLWLYSNENVVLFSLIPYSVGVGLSITILIINEYDKLRAASN